MTLRLASPQSLELLKQRLRVLMNSWHSRLVQLRRRHLEEEVLKLRSELAQATQSQVLQTNLHDELRSKLNSLQRSYEGHQRDTKDELAKLHSELDSRERSVMEADHRAAEANLALSSYKHKMELELTELSNRASEASDRAAQVKSAKESADLGKCSPWDALR